MRNTETTSHTGQSKRRPISVTVRETLVSEARDYGLNTSRAAEAGIEAALKRAKEEAWLAENKAAIEAYNERIERFGTLIKPMWLAD
ncbi:MAG: type II toxin-antitoxin system CcdA family antitoxin [Hyphomicrobium sp.]|nr:type II toxin-antitoxin system CcdA family antitoxin [Hyphomicrobium sp.]